MARRVATYVTNSHPAPRACGICPAPIVDGQGAYVRQDGKGANHITCPDGSEEVWCDRHGRIYGEHAGCPDCYLD